MSGVDWSAPIEAVHEDGRVVPAHIKVREVHWGRSPETWSSIVVNGQTAHLGWRIRNAAQALKTAPTAPSGGVVGPEVVERMIALVRELAKVTTIKAPWIIEARAIVALLPEPIDGDLVEARECAAQAQLLAVGELTRAGKMDDQPIVIAALAAIKRGRALAAGGR